jgi:hypothetical protein
LAVLALGIGPAQAQTWEASYGQTTKNEYGFKRVAPVVGCPGGGTIAIGTSGANLLQLWFGPFPVNPNDPDVYIVRTNAFGARIWENTYDIGGRRGVDIGSAIRETPIGDGFVATGTTDLAQPHTDVFLLRIDCNGAVLATNTYTSPMQGNEYGMDLLVAPPTNPSTGNRFDIVVAGITRSTAPFASLAIGTGGDGLLLRTNENGGMLWNRAYDLGAEEGFAGVTEAGPPPGPNLARELVAVGLRGTPAAGGNAWMVRVNGNNGAIVPGPGSLQNAADYASPLFDDFRSVIELTSPAEAGNLVAVGVTSNQGYILKTTGNPCIPIVDQAISDVAIWDVKEVQDTHAIALPGDLAITGEHITPSTFDVDAFLLTLGAPILTPLVGSGRLYGNHNGPFDAAASLHEVRGVGGIGNGFLISGVTTSSFEGLGDPQDMYLIKTDPAGNTKSCEKTWDPVYNPPKLPVTCLMPQITPVLIQKPQTTVAVPLFTAFLRPECSSGGGIGTAGK